MKKRICAGAILGTLVTDLAAQEWLDTLDESLFIQSPGGLVRTDLSGLVDAEGYFSDLPAPGLLFQEKKSFFNPRLSLFLDTRVGEHLYSLVQIRVDRGFDPGVTPNGDLRFDEYFLRYTPLAGPEVNLQAGKFATVFGNWVPRHDSWNNPFITAPVAYENVFTISDQTVPPSPQAFLGRRNRPDQKSTWNTIIWGPSYATGGALFGRVQNYDYAFEVKNAGLSSRPSEWSLEDRDFDHPTVTGRIGYRPNAAWNVGANASYGSYLLHSAERFLPRGNSLSDYSQFTVGPDVSFAWHHLQIWAEAYASRFEVPNVGGAETVAYHIEAKYKLDESWFTAIRWNQQLFGKVNNGRGGESQWDRDLWRTDLGLGYRFNRHWQAKLQYSYTREEGDSPQGEQLLAAQLTLKF